MKPSFLILSAVGLFAAFALGSCAPAPSDQFGYAVTTGNVEMARANSGPNFANMRIHSSANQSASAMEIAIARNDTQMADFLLKNGASRTINGRSLAYYASMNGRPEMARFFSSRGIGSRSDIALASSEHEDTAREQREDYRRTMNFIGGVLGMAAAADSQGGDGNSIDDDRLGMIQKDQRAQERAQQEANSSR